MSDILDSIDNHLDSLDSGSQQVTETAKEQIIPIYLSSDGKTTWQDDRLLIVRRAILSTSLADRYVFRIGTDQSFRWRQIANTAYTFITSDGPVLIPRGTDFTIVPQTTSPTWDCLLYCVAADPAGSTDVRQ